MKKRLCYLGGILFFIIFSEIAFGNMEVKYSKDTLPKVLNPLEEHLYKTAIKLQDNGYWEGATFVRSAIKNKLLNSWLDYNAYSHHLNPQGGFKDLNQFIKDYPKHPYVKIIYKRAKKMRTYNDEKLEVIKTKQIGIKNPQTFEKPAYPTIEKTSFKTEQVKLLKREAYAYIKKKDYRKAEQLLLRNEAMGNISALEVDTILVKIMRLLFNEGKDKEVIRLAIDITKRNGNYLGESWWLAGLASWRRQNYEEAAFFFREITKRLWLHDNLVYGGYYWLARSSFMLKKYDEWQNNLRKAAQNNSNFYGLLSAETLGKNYINNVVMHTKRLDQLLGKRQGQRFLALMQLGKESWAKDELLSYVHASSIKDRLVLLWLMGEMEWIDLVYPEGQKLRGLDNINITLALPRFPKNWQPETGMVMDEALTLAIVQKESVFKENAKSSAGAFGLMQITQQTKKQTQKIYKINKNYNLSSSSDNIYIGQRYMNYLLSEKWFKGNLFYALAGWNAGPSNAKRWKEEIWRFAHDPIFWIESIPVKETRLYVKEVSANLWQYRDRLGQPSITLKALAQGREPIYNNIDFN